MTLLGTADVDWRLRLEAVAVRSSGEREREDSERESGDMFGDRDPGL